MQATDGNVNENDKEITKDCAEQDSHLQEDTSEKSLSPIAEENSNPEIQLVTCEITTEPSASENVQSKKSIKVTYKSICAFYV